MSAFFISVPHSGEDVPSEVTWLGELAEATLMRDIDRYVDLLYLPVIKEQKLKSIFTPWHRYVVDLNRRETDFDQTAVVGAKNLVGTHPKGLHWSITTQKEVLIKEPMSMDLHTSLVQKYYRPFHEQVQKMRKDLRSGANNVYQLDAHSMPSLMERKF